MAIAASFPSIKPSLSLDFANVGALDPRVTFTRSTTGTYYDGVTTAKAEENLLTYSQQFDNAAWSKTNSTVTANSTTAPDGTSTAETFADDATSGQHAIGSVGQTFLAGGPYVFSIFAKAGTASWIQLRQDATPFANNTFANFDLTNGIVGVTGAGATSASITSIGNGWYRCVLVATTDVGGGLYRAFVNLTNNTDSATLAPAYSGSGQDVYLWGAQLEQRSSVTAYTPTTTQPITNYIPVLQTAAAGQARFDHNPTTGEALGLLIEEQRTNLMLRSEEFDNASWTIDAVTKSANTTVAPDGAISADTLTETTLSGNHRVYQTLSKAASAITYTVSCYTKNNGRNFRLSFDSGTVTNSVQATFDLLAGTIATAASTTGTYSAASATINSVGDGWYRCTVTATTGTETTVRPNIWLIDGTSANYTGDGYSGIFIWGAQLEAGAFPTSYIPTTSAQVTRNADAASMTGTNFSSWFNNGEGTLFADIAWDYGSDKVPNNRIGASLGSASNSVIIIYNINGFSGGYYMAKNGVQQALSNAAAATSAYTKSAVSYQPNNINFSYNGATVPPDTTAEVPIMDKLSIGSSFTNTAYLSGHIRKIAYYPQALTATNIQALTA